MKRLQVTMAAMLLAYGVLGCGGEEPAQEPTEKIVVTVSILPLAWFAEQIGGDYVDVHVLVGPGQSPATYDLFPQQMKTVQQSRLLLAAGVPFERVLFHKLKYLYPDLMIVDTRHAIDLLAMDDAEHGDHDHGDYDPHVWLDPALARRQAATIRTALAEVDPTHAADYMENLVKLDSDLAVLERRFSEDLAGLAGARMYVAHPAYGYLAKAYGLEQVPIEIEGKEPTGAALAEFVENARRDNVAAIFVQPQFASTGARAIAEEIGVEVVELNPLPQDYVADMGVMVEKLKQYLRPGA